MSNSGGGVGGEGGFSVPLARSAAAEYHRFLTILAARAKRLGARDPESAAQEALRRSLEHPSARPAIEYYFSPDPNAELKAPEWPLDQLLAWLHGVVTNVAREEHNRASTRREIPFARWGENGNANYGDPVDPAAGQLHVLLQMEMEAIVRECLPGLGDEYRTVLSMRSDGAKYSEIASRLGVNENTVATWVSRGIRELGDRVRKRMSRNLQ